MTRSISEFLKLAKVLLVLTPSSVEDEQTFSSGGVVQNDQRNKMLPGHLNDCMRMFKQKWCNVDTFPYEKAQDARH